MPQSKTNFGKDWEVVLSPSAFGAALAVCQRCRRRTQRRTEAMEGMQQEVQANEGRWVEETPQRWRQPKGEDRTEMKTEARAVRCALLNGSARSTEKKYMRRYKGKRDIFFGMEHRLSKEEIAEWFNKETKEGWRFVADVARIADETAGSEDRKHTSGGVFVAVDSDLGAVVGV